MHDSIYNKRLNSLIQYYRSLVSQSNESIFSSHGFYTKFKNPILTAEHIPLTWRYDFNQRLNPYLLERISYNAVFNAGAIKWQGKYIVCARVEGFDRKSFFAIAESPNGFDNFTFWDKPCQIPMLNDQETNIYDMRLTQHEDGWIYGLFCTEKKDPNAGPYDTSSAIAQCGIVKTKDLIHWQRLRDVNTPSNQQRNVVLHPEFVHGKYAFYTRPQDGFIEAGSGGGVAIGYTDDIHNVVLMEETIIHQRRYHTVYELKNGQGPSPIKTKHGWLHLAHGVRNTAAGLRYVLYMFMTDLANLSKIIYQPSGYFMAPEHSERIGDVSNVVFSNGWILDDDNDTIFIYYGASDTRLQVAKTSLALLLDYVMNTPSDNFTSFHSVANINNLIDSNEQLSPHNQMVTNVESELG